ncbi:MAG: hypothetical protein KDC84_11110, partial [Crocinitomicaceae bacterium]|nr:hypothetical protein [Crocinitomicaceae bacterium]
MKKTILFLSSIALGINMFAQELMDQIPANSNFVIQLGFDQMEKIYPTSKLFKQEIWMDAAKELDVKTLSETGINYKKPALFSAEFTDTCNYFSLHYEIANSKQYYEFLAKNMRNMELTKNYKGSGITLVKNNQNGYMFVTETYAVIVFAEINRNYRRNNIDYLLEVYYEELRQYEYEYEQKDAIQGILARERMLELLMNKGNSFKTSKSYQLKDETHEITVWMNLLFSKLQTINELGFRGLGGVMSILDSYSVYDVSMEKGAINMDMQMDFSPEIKSEMMALVKNRKLNPELFKYLPKERLMTYALSNDPGAYYQWMKKYIAEAIGRRYFSNGTMNDIVDLIGTILDEKAISTLMTGDVVASWNKMEVIEYEYKSNRYNDNFEMEEYVKKRKVEFPQFTVVTGIQNMDFFQKILNILKRENLVKEENDYLLIPAGREIPSGLGIYLKNNVLIISNDFQMLNGLKENKDYGKEEMDTETSFYAHLNIRKLFDFLAEETTNFYEYNGFDFVRKTFDELEIRSITSQKDHFQVSTSLKMVDSKSNAYVSAMNGLNDMYVKSEVNKDKGKYEFYSAKLNAMIKKYEA